MATWLLTCQQVADELGVTRWAVYGLIRRGALPARRVDGRELRVSAFDLDTYVERAYKGDRRPDGRGPVHGKR